MPALIALLVLVAPTEARAQDSALERARQHLERSEFEDFDRALDEAARGELDGPALRAWLELKVLGAYSAEHLGAMEEALAGLACLMSATDPAPANFPRAARERLAELRAAGARIELAAEITTRASDGGRELGVVSEIVHDPGHLVRSLRVVASFDDGAERAGEGAVHETIGGDASRDVAVRYHVEAIGPGGAVVGSLGEPWIEDVAAGLPADETGLHVGIAVATGVLVAGGLAVAFAAVATDGFRVGGPTTLDGPVIVPLLRF